MGRKRKVRKVNFHGKEGYACSKAATCTEKTYSHTDHNSNPMEVTNIENTVPPYSSPPRKKINSKGMNVVIRRSNRLKNSVLYNENQKMKTVMEPVNLVEIEKEEALDGQQVSTLQASERNMEEEAPQVEQRNTLPVVNEQNLDKKIDYIVRAVDEFKSKTFTQGSRRPSDGTSNDLSYKSLYIESQKKIEALMEKHYELVRDLEFAKGKIDAYEKMLKAMAALVPRVDNNAEAMSLSPRTVQGFVSATGPGAPDDQNASPSNAADLHKISPKQKKNASRRKKAKS